MKNIEFQNMAHTRDLFGQHNKNLDKICEAFDVEINDRGKSLAFMRGRALNNAFVILDKAQNTTSEQIKMFLTRIGYGSKAIEFIYFSKDGGVRHKLVSNIIEAYEKKQKRK